jgi:hypothetical protein
MKVPKAKKEESKEEKINPRKIQQSYMDKIETELKEEGNVFFDETMLNIDEDHLALPREITEVPSKELGEYLNAFTQQKLYVRTLLGRVESVLDEKKENYYKASNEIYRKYSLDSKLSETAKERLVVMNPEVNPVYQEYTEYARKYSILQNTIASIEDAIFMISREVTRRTGDFFDENRNHNVGRR